MFGLQEEFEAITKSKLFFNLSKFSRLMLATVFDRWQYKIGDMPIKQGDLKQEIILVQSGCCDLIHERMDARA